VVAREEHTEVLIEKCIQWIYKLQGSYASADIVRTNVSALFRDWFFIAGAGGNSMVRQALSTMAHSRKPAGIKRRIWNIGYLIEKIKEEAQKVALEELGWEQMVGRVGILLLTFTGCRISDMFSIRPSKSVWECEDGSIMLAMSTKDSRRRLKYKVLPPINDTAIDPITTVKAYRNRCVEGENGEAFFTYESGRPIETAARLSSGFLTPYLRNKGIPPPYTPYSIKTAVTTSLFNMGNSTAQVSAYTGHSTNANTALKHYHDATNSWLGRKVALLSDELLFPALREDNEESE
jgi:hypothetical protein